MSDSLCPHGLQPTRLLCPWISQARILEWGAISSSRGSSQTQGSNLRLLHQQASYFTTEPPGGNLSYEVLWWIFWLLKYVPRKYLMVSGARNLTHHCPVSLSQDILSVPAHTFSRFAEPPAFHFAAGERCPSSCWLQVQLIWWHRHRQHGGSLFLCEP